MSDERPVGDQGGAVIGALAAIVGLLAKSKTGSGQHMGTSLVDAVLVIQSAQMTEHLHHGTDPAKGGRFWRGHFPQGPYTAADGDIMIHHSSDDRTWAKPCELLEIDNFLADERYATPDRRT